MLRGIRFAAGLQLRIDPATRGRMKQSVRFVRAVPPRAEAGELLEILELSQAATALTLSIGWAHWMQG